MFHWRAPHEIINSHKKKICLEQNISIGSFHASVHNIHNVSIYVKWPQKLVMSKLIILKYFWWTHVLLWGTDTPVLDFWWLLLCVSKPEWPALFALGRGIYDVHFLRFTSGVTPSQPSDCQHGGQSLSPHTCYSTGRIIFDWETSHIAVRHANRSDTVTGLVSRLICYCAHSTPWRNINKFGHLRQYPQFLTSVL